MAGAQKKTGFPEIDIPHRDLRRCLFFNANGLPVQLFRRNGSAQLNRSFNDIALYAPLIVLPDHTVIRLTDQ